MLDFQKKRYVTDGGPELPFRLLGFCPHDKILSRLHFVSQIPLLYCLRPTYSPLAGNRLGPELSTNMVSNHVMVRQSNGVA